MHKLILLVFFFLPWQNDAATLHIKVTDAAQRPVPYTVIELLNDNYPAEPEPEVAHVIQKDLNFQPFVSMVQQGTLIDFPNLDKTRHHVYSFSKAKVFELRLYAGKPEAPVLFDQAGVVTLGCNIHDNMLAYIYVSTSRFTALTDANGDAHFNDLPQTSFQLKTWHPWQKQPSVSEEISIRLDEQYRNITLDITQQALPQARKKGFDDY